MASSNSRTPDIAPIRLFAIADVAAARSLVQLPPAPWLCIQLRDRTVDTSSLLDCAAAIVSSGHRLCVNDRVDVALAAGAEAVQLGRGSMSVAEGRRIAPGLAWGRSVHSLAEAAAARQEGADFCLLSPILATPGADKGPALGLSVLTEAVARSGEGGKIPIYALGGIDVSAAPQCLAVGAAGVAAIRGARALVEAAPNWLP